MENGPEKFGWRVVGAAFVVAAFGWGMGFYGPPVFLHAVEAGRGWPTWLVSAAVTAHFLAGAAVVALLPRLHRCFGIVAVTRAGAVSAALGALGWALAAEPWQLFLATLPSGAGWAATGAAAINAIVAPWFAARRPVALATAFNGASLGGVVLSPLWVVLIGRVGFGWAAVLIGGTMVATLWWLAGRYLGRSPSGAALAADRGPAPTRRVQRLWSDRGFRRLVAANAIGLFAQIGLVAHLVALLAPALGVQGAGLAMALATACAIVGRFVMARLLRPGADRWRVAAANYAVQVLGSAILLAAGPTPALLLLGVALFGFGLGNAVSLPPLIAQQAFPEVDLARVVALVVATGQASYAFAPAAFGLLRAADPDLLFLAAAALQALAGLVLLLRR
jgi:hypothetical protein